MRIMIIMIIGLMVSNCSNSSYVKNKKTITSPDDLQKFINVYCNKNKQTDKVIKVCGNGWSKDLNISESKAVLSAKIKIADTVIGLFNTVPTVEVIQGQFNDLEKELIKEYGENAVIDLRTGEVKDPEEPKEDGKDK